MCTLGRAQPAVSIATDFSLLRSFTPKQPFFAVGQTVQGQLHFSKKESAYISICYYTNGKYKNKGVATAINTGTVPQQVAYTINSTLRYRQLSVGWKHYVTGYFNNETSWNIYGLAGFGLLFGQTTNNYSQLIDTATYKAPVFVRAGEGDFKRLTFDLGLGAEVPLGTVIYFYTELKTWIPTSAYPSTYLVNNNTPRVALLSGGMRVLLQ